MVVPGNVLSEYDERIIDFPEKLVDCLEISSIYSTKFPS